MQDPTLPEKWILYNSSIYASTYSAACKMAAQRNIGELVVGSMEPIPRSFDPSPLPSFFYQTRKMIECLHTLTFYSWVGACCGVVKAIDVLSDVGLIHEIIHEMHHPSFYGYRQEVFDRLKSFESLIPGLRRAQQEEARVETSRTVSEMIDVSVEPATK